MFVICSPGYPLQCAWKFDTNHQDAHAVKGGHVIAVHCLELGTSAFMNARAAIRQGNV